MASANGKNHSGHFLENKTIIIAGAGIAGSAFVVGLQKLWDTNLGRPNIIIYERDAQDVATQRETYNLSLTGFDDSGGLVALRKLGLLDEALEKAVSGIGGIGSFKIWDSRWKEQVSFSRKPVSGIPSTSIRISRQDVRQAIHNSIRLDHHCAIRWESQCVSATHLSDGRLRVRVVHGNGDFESEQDCHLLIAADGANSKLRQSLRPNDTLVYNGAVLRGGIAAFQGCLPKQLSEDWGFVVSRTGVSAFFSPVDEHRILWTIGHKENQVPRLDRRSQAGVQAVMDKSLELGSHIPEPFPSMVKQTDPETVLLLNSRDKMPFRHRDIAEIPAIFLGDSNHALSPFAGIGANLALVDAWDLANQLCSKKNLEEAVKTYDGISVTRAARHIKRSRGMIKAAHDTGWRYYLFWCMLFMGKLMRWVWILCYRLGGGGLWEKR